MSDSASSTSTALEKVTAAPAPATSSRVEMIIPGTALSFGDTARLAKTLFLSGLLGTKIKSPEQAFAIIVAGAEMGLPPMLALRSLSLVEGKIVLAADSQLALFKKAGGRTSFEELTTERAVLYLRHPNGDEHTEEWTRAMAQTAGVLAKDNWKKYPLAMMRSRAITAGLKSIGFEATAGAYDPDEDLHILDDEPGPIAALPSPESRGRGAMARLKERLEPPTTSPEAAAEPETQAAPEEPPEPPVVTQEPIEGEGQALTPEYQKLMEDEWDRLDREEAARHSVGD